MLPLKRPEHEKFEGGPVRVHVDIRVHVVFDTRAEFRVGSPQDRGKREEPPAVRLGGCGVTRGPLGAVAIGESVEDVMSGDQRRPRGQPSQRGILRGRVELFLKLQ